MNEHNNIYLLTCLSFFSVFILIALTYKTPFVVQLDMNVYSFIMGGQSSGLTNAAKIISEVGSEYFIVPLLALLIIMKKTRYIYGLPAGLTVLAAFIINSIIKPLFKRQRPGILPLVIEISYSFPSAHSMNNMALYGALSLLLLSTGKGKAGIAASILFFIIAILIGLSRIYLGVHYFSDVCAGLAFGLSLAFAMRYILLWFTESNRYYP